MVELYFSDSMFFWIVKKNQQKEEFNKNQQKEEFNKE